MKTIIGNWKMHLTVRESVALARAVVLSVRGKTTVPDIVICPTFTAMSDVRKVLEHSRVALGAQNMFWEDAGAYTGEVSPLQLKDLNCTHVILGHSERRQILGETDDVVRKKLERALELNMAAIVCVGETKEERAAGASEDKVASQVTAALDGLELKKNRHLMFAYEPVWAIGTDKPAKPEDAVSMHKKIRETAAKFLPENKMKQVSVIYGGSVDENDVHGFLREPFIEGVLVGGASIRAKQFHRIIETAIGVIEAQR